MVLQDHDTSWPLDTREWRGACRMGGKNKYGQRFIEPDTAGDIICSTMWAPDTREMCAWANVFPTVSLGTHGDSGIGPSGEAGDPNVGAPGGKGDGGAAGAPSAGGGSAGGGGGGGSNVRPGTSVDPWAGRAGGNAPRTTYGDAPAGSPRRVDVGASIFTNGRLVWSGAAREKRASVVKYSKKWWEQQRKKQLGAAGGVGAEGASGVGGSPNRDPVVTGEKSSEAEPRTVGMLPMRDEGHAVDRRFSPSGALLPDYWPSFPEGVVGIRVGGTEEQSQQEVWLPTDPRLFAVNFGPKGIMGSLVYDLENEKIAVGQGLPGVAGRGARLQTMMRVVKLPASPAHLEVAGTPCGNVLAWQGTMTGQEGWPGLGAYYTVSRPSNDSTQTETGAGVGDVAGEGNSGRPEVSDLTNVNPGFMGPGGGIKSSKRSNVCAFADAAAMGPFHGGFDKDKHKIDTTLDGEKMHPVHISTGAYFAKTEEKDAPLFFEDLPYNANQFPMAAKVHLVYDDTESHQFFKETRQGFWKWFAEVPYMGSGPPTPRPPPPSRGPETPPGNPPPPPNPRPPGDVTPPYGPLEPPMPPRRPGAPGDPSAPTDPGPREVAFREVAAGGRDHVIWSPDAWAFGAFVFRPQHTGPGMQDFRGGRYTQDQAVAEDRQRPVVLRMEAYGKKAGQSWGYSRRPSASRYMGGEAAGGVVFLAAPVDMADSRTSWSPTDRSMPDAYVVAGPSVHFAWGTPDETTGAIGTSGWRARRGSVSGNNSSLFLEQYNGTAWEPALQLTREAAGLSAAFGGTAYVQLPSGTTAQRPGGGVAGMVRQNSDLGVFEGYVTSWRTLQFDPEVTPKPADSTLAATDSNQLLHNTGAPGSSTQTLPTAASGLRFTFVVGANQNFAARAAGSDTIRVAGSVSSGGGTATSNVVGDVLRLEAIGSVWYATSVVGTWTLA